jgi:hypothetical protein
MKSLYAPLATAFTAMILASGCSDRTPPAPASEQKSVGDAYQAALPSAFASKGIQLGGRCFVDDVNGQPVTLRNEVPRDRLLTIDGWVTDTAATAPRSVAVELASMGGTQSYYVPAHRVTRPGLGQALKNPALDEAGLQSTATLSGVAPGSYSVMLLVAGDQVANRCVPNVVVFIK